MHQKTKYFTYSLGDLTFLCHRRSSLRYYDEVVIFSPLVRNIQSLPRKGTNTKLKEFETCEYQPQHRFPPSSANVSRLRASVHGLFDCSRSFHTYPFRLIFAYRFTL